MSPRDGQAPTRSTDISSLVSVIARCCGGLVEEY